MTLGESLGRAQGNVRSHPRVAVVVSHPIQHFCPQYASIAKDVDCHLRVFFASRAGASKYYDPLFGREVTWDGLKLEQFAHEFVNDDASAPSSPTIDAPRLPARLSAFDPDVVIVYGYRQRLQRRALTWAKAHDKKVLFMADSELRQHRSAVTKVLKQVWLTPYFRKIDGFLTIGDANEEYYRNYGVDAERMYRSPYPIDRELYDVAYADRKSERRRMRDALEIDEATFCCLCVGKFVHWKRQRDAIRMLAEKGMTDTVLTLAGTGPDEMKLRELAEECAPGRVRFVGFVQPAELPAYYLASDVYVHPAEREPHSVAVSEAIYLGIPVVISDRCGSYGPSDDVQQGRNGFVYSCGDIGGLANRLAVLRADASLRAQFGTESRTIGVGAQSLAHAGGIRAALVGVTR